MKVETPEPLTKNDFHRVNKWNRLFYSSLLIGAVIFLTVGSFYIYWISQSSDVLTFKTPLDKNLLEITKPLLKPGDWQTVKIDYCKQYNIPEKQSIVYLVGEQLELRLSTTPESSNRDASNVESGCHHLDVPILIPSADKLVLPGIYHIRFETIYDVNPLMQNVVEKVSTQDFTIDQ